MRVSEILPKISHGALPLRAMLADLSSHLEKIAERRGWAIPPLILAFLGLFGFLFSLAEDVHTIIWAWEQWPFSGVVVLLHLGVNRTPPCGKHDRARCRMVDSKRKTRRGRR